MKTILTSSIVVAVLALGVSGCGGSSSTKKVYLDGNGSNASSHQVGTSSTDSGSRESSDNNIDRVAINIGSQTVQNLHLSTSTTDYKALSISGDGRSNFIILEDGDVYPKNGIANGEYSIVIHAKSTEKDSTDTIDKALIVEVTGSSVVADDTTTQDDTDTDTTTQDDTNSSQTSNVSGFTAVKDESSTYSEALAGCGATNRLPTYAELESNLDTVKDLVKDIDSDGDSNEMPNIFRSVIWTAENADGTVDGMWFKWNDTTSTTSIEKLEDIDTATNSYFYTCVPK